jgi:hypothetical protein
VSNPDSSHFARLKYWDKHAQLHDGFVFATDKGKMQPTKLFGLLNCNEVVDI